MRSFNTEGPVVRSKHYTIPPLTRLDLNQVRSLIAGERYFVLHAPRQTGKTSALLALRDELNGTDDPAYRCVYASVEAGEAAGDNLNGVMRVVFAALAKDARSSLQDDFVAQEAFAILERVGPESALIEVLTAWAEADDRPLVLLLDEVDALAGRALLSLLHQLRTGYYSRPQGFPQSVILCGLRDIRHYRVGASTWPRSGAGGSPFNISAASLRLGDFARGEVLALLAQHTEESGQVFQPETLALVWEKTLGQPWLVNALCQQACFASERGRQRDRPITEDDILDAQEILILNRSAHIHQLADRLLENRVRRVIEPLLAGGQRRMFTARDVEYARDLGLIALDAPIRIANPIYREVVPRELTADTQADLVQEAAWYVCDGGRLDLSALLEAFQQYFGENSEFWLERYEYKEAGPHLLLHAFLQWVVNGGGRIEREYGLGRGRADLMIAWPAGSGTQRFIVECKVLRRGLERTISEGLRQTAAYMDRCGADEGHLVIFDRRRFAWRNRVFRRRESVDSVPIEVWGM